MPTMIVIRRFDGTVRRCDARCHYAKQPRCKCICGGIFHGAARTPGGIEKAKRKYAEKFAELMPPERVPEEVY